MQSLQAAETLPDPWYVYYFEDGPKPAPEPRKDGKRASGWLSARWGATTTKMTDIVTEIIGNVDAYEEHYALRKRRRRPDDRLRMERTVECVVCHLTEEVLHGREDGLAVTQRIADLGRKDRYKPRYFATSFPKLIGALGSQDLAFIDVDKGFRGQSTIIKAGERLRNRIETHALTAADIGKLRSEYDETIALRTAKLRKGKKGRPVDYEDTAQTTLWRQQMVRINDALGAARIDLTAGLTDKDGTRVDPYARSLRRIFNLPKGQETAEGFAWNRGGRLYGGFWQGMSGETRCEHVEIGGEPVVELDYSAAALNLAYAGRTMPEGDLYAMPGLEGTERAGRKQLVNAMLCADKYPTRWYDGVERALGSRATTYIPPLDRSIDRVLAHHSAIADRFFSDQGMRLQFEESEIMVDVLLRLLDKGIIALPIHDAVLVNEAAEEEAKEVMVSCFQERTGVIPKVTSSCY